MDSINFKALPIIKQIKIQKFDKKTKQYVDCKANFVKLTADNRDDLKAVNACEQKWKGAAYIQKIATAAHWLGYRNGTKIDVYALTTQKNNFNKLNPKNILGLAEIRTNEATPQNAELYHLQVKPTAISINGTNKSYKKVGTSIVRSLQKMYKTITLFSDKTPEVKKFYENLGFIEDYCGEDHYTWSSNLLKKLKIRFDKFKLDYLI